MNKVNLASLFLSLLLVLGLCFALMPTTAKAADIPSDESFGTWNEDKPTYTLTTDETEAVVFLVSDSAKFITAEVLDVNGGCLMD